MVHLMETHRNQNFAQARDAVSSLKVQDLAISQRIHETAKVFMLNAREKE